VAFEPIRVLFNPKNANAENFEICNEISHSICHLLAPYLNYILKKYLEEIEASFEVLVLSYTGRSRARRGFEEWCCDAWTLSPCQASNPYSFVVHYIAYSLYRAISAPIIIIIIIIIIIQFFIFHVLNQQL
jgi:hypothetical protein